MGEGGNPVQSQHHLRSLLRGGVSWSDPPSPQPLFPCTAPPTVRYFFFLFLLILKSFSPMDVNVLSHLHTDPWWRRYSRPLPRSHGRLMKRPHTKGGEDGSWLSSPPVFTSDLFKMIFLSNLVVLLFSVHHGKYD